MQVTNSVQATWSVFPLHRVFEEIISEGGLPRADLPQIVQEHMEKVPCSPTQAL